ncbi:hypothetical protein CBL_11043 [Carabus blaptoides fortunei]
MDLESRSAEIQGVFYSTVRLFDLEPDLKHYALKVIPCNTARGWLGQGSEQRVETRAQCAISCSTDLMTFVSERRPKDTNNKFREQPTFQEIPVNEEYKP